MKKILLGFVVLISVAQINASNASLPSNMTVQQYIQSVTQNAQAQYNTALSQFNQATSEVCALQEPIFVNLCADMKKAASDIINSKPSIADFGFYLSAEGSFISYIQGANDVINVNSI